MRMLVEEHPVLTRLVTARGLNAGPGLRAELEGIIGDFTADAGVHFQVVDDGVVQAAREVGDFGSMRVQEGAYLVERAVYDDDARLLEELTHQIPSYFGSRRVGQNWTSPVWLSNNAAEWLENTILAGGLGIWDRLPPVTVRSRKAGTKRPASERQRTRQPREQDFLVGL